MRLLAFTDLHGDISALESSLAAAGGIDGILVLGDVGVTHDSIARVYARLAREGVAVHVIHGNHEDEDVARDLAAEHGLVFVHRSIARIGSLSVIGYGGDGFSTSRADLDAFISELPEGLAHRSIVLTHAPPSDTVLDELEVGHVGDESVRRLIERVRPLVALSGHLHENFHRGATLGDSIIANPGIGSLIVINESGQGYAVSLKRL